MASMPDKETRAKLLNEFRKLLSRNKEGLDNNTLQQKWSEMGASKESQVALLNAILGSGKIELLKDSENQLVYRMISKKVADQLSKMDSVEKIVYQLVKSSGRRGIWLKELRQKSNIENNLVITKIIRALARKQLIKSVPSPDWSNRKTYMLYELEPLPAKSANAFCQGNGINEELVRLVYDAVEGFIGQENTGSTAGELCEFVNERGAAKGEIGEKDVEVILNLLMADEKVERRVARKADDGKVSEHVSYFKKRCRVSYKMKQGVGQIPCVSCPMSKSCFVESAVNPRTCEYLSDWLNN